MSTQLSPSSATATTNDLGLKCCKVVALAATDVERARRFYGETLGLPRYTEGGEIAFHLGETLLMPKSDWDQQPTDNPHFRITLECDNASTTEERLRSKGVQIADPVQSYEGRFLIGSFLDSEGNKLWFCSNS